MSGFIIDPDNALPDEVRGAVAETVWTGSGELYDTFSQGDPPTRWFIAGVEVPEQAFRRHVEVVERNKGRVDQLEMVDECLRGCGYDAMPRADALLLLVAELHELRAHTREGSGS